ncbi:MAG: hypothetical protein CMI05_12095, partial [Oceanospirillaceae bacterium]|nr:hypothetical protein [Oceanospirillaceae bacterium]
ESFDKNVNQVENEAVSLAATLQTLIKNKQAGVNLEKVDVSNLEWSELAESYRQIITQIAAEK